MPIFFLLLIFSPPAFAREYDPLRAASIRAEVIARKGCDKYCWYEMRVLENLGGKLDVSTVAVAAMNNLPPAPSGEFLVYLERYNEEDPSLWKVQDHPGITLFRSTSSLHGLTAGQCRERQGRLEDDYDKGCSDKEVALGTVLFMMCPCSCCAPSSGAPLPSSLRDLPEPMAALYAGVTDLRDWQNPFLTVESKGVRVLHRNRIHPKQLIEKLKGLPRESWPYGRIVAVHDALPTGKLRKRDPPLVEVVDIIRMLREAGLEVMEWPRSE